MVVCETTFKERTIPAELRPKVCCAASRLDAASAMIDAAEIMVPEGMATATARCSAVFASA